MARQSNHDLREAGTLDRAALARALGVWIIASVLVCIVLGNMSIWSVAGLVVMTTILLARRSFACVVFILIFCLGHRLAIAWIYGFSRMSLDLGDLLLVIAILSFTAASTRYISLDPRRFSWQGATTNEVSTRTGHVGSAGLRPISFDLLRLPAAAALVWVILAILSQDAFWPNLYRFDPAVLRTIAVAWILAMLVCVPVGVLSLIRWRKLGTAQAEIYVRGELAREARREQRQVERALARGRKKVARNRWNEDVADPS